MGKSFLTDTSNMTDAETQEALKAAEAKAATMDKRIKLASRAAAAGLCVGGVACFFPALTIWGVLAGVTACVGAAVTGLFCLQERCRREIDVHLLKIDVQSRAEEKMNPAFAPGSVLNPIFEAAAAEMHSGTASDIQVARPLRLRAGAGPGAPEIA